MKNEICWIDVVPEAEADSALQSTYNQVRAPDGQLDNLYQAFSLRPHTIKPADDLYIAAMHNDNNTIPKWFSELIGTYVAILTGCAYAKAHHGQNYHHLIGDRSISDHIIDSLHSGNLSSCGSNRDVVALSYVKQLVLTPQSVSESGITDLRDAGWTDGEILEIVQVVAMFSYFVRVINGVGIQLGDEKIGLY